MKYPKPENSKSWSDLVAESRRERSPEIDVSHEVRAALIKEGREIDAVDWVDELIAIFKFRSIQVVGAIGIACIILLTVVSFLIPSTDTVEDPVIAFITEGDWSVSYE